MNTKYFMFLAEWEGSYAMKARDYLVTPPDSYIRLPLVFDTRTKAYRLKQKKEQENRENDVLDERYYQWRLGKIHKMLVIPSSNKQQALKL